MVLSKKEIDCKQYFQELREGFDKEKLKGKRERLLLTMAVPAGVDTIEKGYDLTSLNRYPTFNLIQIKSSYPERQPQPVLIILTHYQLFQLQDNPFEIRSWINCWYSSLFELDSDFSMLVLLY